MPDGPEPNPRRTVLFVDDEPLFLEMIELLAREQGGSWEVILTSTAQRALEVLEEQTIDLAVIDLRMPVMDGLKLLEIMQQHYPQLIKVVLTGFASEESKAACLKEGANFYLPKPQSVEQMKTIFTTLQELISVQPAKGFRGMLVRVDLPEVIQMECLSRHSSILEVITDPVRGEIYIKEGNIIHAQTNQKEGEPAFQQLLELSGGEFKLKAYCEPPAITIQGSWEFLLMEAMRKRDEFLDARKALAPLSPGPGPVSPSALVTRPIQQNPPLTTASVAPARPSQPPVSNDSSTSNDPNAQPATGPGALNRTNSGAHTHPARIEETVVCSPRGEVLHQWQCASVEQRLQLLHLISETVARLDSELPTGPFKRLEIESDEGRLVLVAEKGNRILVRSRRGESS